MQDLIIQTELCSISMIRRVAAMLDVDSQTFSEGVVMPKGWHFFMLAGETRKSALRSDGFPGLGVPIPDLGLPRLLLGGRTVAYKSDIVIGSVVERTSFIKNIREKTTDTGKMAIVTIHHELRPITASTPAIVETQTYILLEEKKGQTTPESQILAPIVAEYKKQIVPDETLLFQYSALGFNSHKIHLDKEYTKNIENLPDLVVNGGLATLLLTEFTKNDLGINLNEITVKHIAPLFCNRPMTLAADSNETGWKLRIFDDKNVVAVEMIVHRLD